MLDIRGNTLAHQIHLSFFSDFVTCSSPVSGLDKSRLKRIFFGMKKIDRAKAAGLLSFQVWSPADSFWEPPSHLNHFKLAGIRVEQSASCKEKEAVDAAGAGVLPELGNISSLKEVQKNPLSHSGASSNSPKSLLNEIFCQAFLLKGPRVNNLSPTVQNIRCVPNHILLH